MKIKPLALFAAGLLICATSVFAQDVSNPPQPATNSVQGIMRGDGSTISCTAGVCTSSGGGGGSTTIVAPQGRLTLVTGTPVMSSDQTAKSTVYYDCYRGSSVPYYTGSADALDTIGSCEVSLTMQTSGTGVTNSAGVFDVWWVHGGTNRICVATNGSGGGWASDTGGSNTARGTGYSQIHNTRGYWTNVNAITNCYNGTTNYGSVSADQGTYLGTLYTTAAGQTGVAFNPAAAAGGSNTIVGLSNGYNRVRIITSSRDSTANWTYGTATWRSMNNNANNRISFVDGLQQSNISATHLILMQGGSATPVIGFNLNSTSSNPQVVAEYSYGTSTHDLTASLQDNWQPVLGFNFVQAVEYCSGGTCQWSADGNGAATQLEKISLQLDM